MGPRKVAEGRQGIVESKSWIKYRVSDSELREALNITAPGSIVMIRSRLTLASKEWIITQAAK